MEIGPYRVRKEGKLELIDGSWDEFANVLFVDNPVGTGFSFVDGDSYIHELQEMADQFITFLEKWFALFPHFSHDDVSPNSHRVYSTILTRYRFTLLENLMPASTFRMSQRPC
jgi:hypothetical protein